MNKPPTRPSGGPPPVKQQPMGAAKGPKKIAGTGVARPTVPKSPNKMAKKAVNYERQMGVANVPPPAGGSGPPPVVRKHSDTLASLPMQEKMKAFESASSASSAAEARRNMWLKKAEEKKAAPAKPKAPKGAAPTPPPKKLPAQPAKGGVAVKPAAGTKAPNKAVAKTAAASPGAVSSPKMAPRAVAPKPPAKKAPAPPVATGSRMSIEEEQLRQQEEDELAAFEAEEEERRRRAAAAEAAARKQREEEERRRREEEERRRREEEERRRREEEERRRREEEEERKRKLEQERKRREAEEEEDRRRRAATASASLGGGARMRTIEVLISVADYAGNVAEGELSFSEGEYVALMKRDESGWWQGEIAGQGSVGWFPSNFCRETTDDEFEAYCSLCNIEPYVEETPKPAPPKARTKSAEPAQPAKAAAAATKAVAAAGAGSKTAAKAGVTKVASSTALAPPKEQKSFPPFGKLSSSMDEFEIQGLLGKGRFGKVYQCKKKDTGRIYAIKALLKTHIESSEAQKVLVEREKSILMKIKGPFLVRCYHIFEDEDKLYFVMECASGGELFVHLSRERSFDPERVRFYAAEMFLALEYLHGIGIIYRDLKPENVLLTAEGHILMTDFGISKEGLDTNQMRTATFCGTPEYLAPEVLLGQGYGKSVDWWSYGSVVYEMLTGLPPYFSDDITEMYKKILQAPLELPAELDKPTRDFLTALLDRNPEKRLQDPKQVRRHPYFRGVDWDKMFNMEVPAPYIPPEEFVYDDDDQDADGPADGGDDFADFDGSFADDGAAEEIPDDGQLRCRSHHDWAGDADGDLPLRVGDVIIVTDNQSDPEGWWTGMDASGRTGVFPCTFVDLI